VRQTTYLPFLLLFLGAILLASYVRIEKAQVEKVLENRRLGLETKDIELYMSSVSPRYGGQAKGASLLREKALEMMTGFDSIQMSVSSRQVSITSITDQSAEALQTYEVKVRKGEQVRELRGKEKVGLRKEEGGWKIVSGL
jgi:hypothetical protein